MVGFAVIGPSFLETHEEWGPQQQMSIILMASRLVLFCQYGAALCFTWRYHRTRTPLLIIMGTLLVAAAIYLGISFVFYRHLDYHCYIVWYVVSVLEAVINVGVASWWPVVSLYKAHLVERMTCLTLIIVCDIWPQMKEVKLTGTARRRNHRSYQDHRQGRDHG